MKVEAATPLDAESATAPRSRAARRTRTVRAIGAGVAALLLASACTSDPGPKRVAQDIIEAEAFRNPELDEECLLRELDRYSEDDLRAIDDDLASSDQARNDEGEAALLAYQRSLEVCA